MLIEHDENDRVDERVGVLEPIGERIVEARHAVAVGLHGPAHNPRHPEDDERARDETQYAKCLFILRIMMSRDGSCSGCFELMRALEAHRRGPNETSFGLFGLLDSGRGRGRSDRRVG